MGAKPSSEAPTDDAFVDYYELLEVDQTDSADTIRKAYRRLALKLHPDKNVGNEVEANRKFVRLQEAYEVLSDETERAWYDQNRDRLIHGEENEDDADVDSKFRFFRSGGSAPKASSAAAGVGVPHLLRFFSPSIAKDLRDTETSFFGTYRRLFDRLAEEDRVAAPYPGEEHTGEFANEERDLASWYPSFGRPDTPYATGVAPVRQFYQFWTNFSSRKSFAWKDLHNLRDAQDRRVKRLMEKENRRAREVARREYNETVRGLAVFIRRRDPRYKAFQASQQSTSTIATAAEEQERRRVEAARRIEAKRAEAESFQAQSWQVVDELQEWTSDFSSGASLDGDESETDEPMWDCVVCDKRFQSQAAWENHERSKKHKKGVQRLRREMLAEDLELGDVDDIDMAINAADGETAELAEGGTGVVMDDNSVEHLDPVDTLAVDKLGLDSEDDTPMAPRKKDKKRKKMEKKMRVAAGASSPPLPVFKDAPPTSELSNGASEMPLTESLSKEETTIDTMLPHLATLPRLHERPVGSFDVFGYGSLIFKPPPHVIGYTPGYIKGFARRFAQHSEDHRGTPERPGRVVTLVSAEHWRSLEGADATPEGDIVWGVSYTIDPMHAEKVRAYLDHREKNGYTPLWEPIWNFEDHAASPVIAVEKALVYVGLPSNPAFVGPQPLDTLAERIHTCSGPSGPNAEYLLRLAEAVRLLTPESVDNHLFALEQKVLALQDAERSSKENAGSLLGTKSGAERRRRNTKPLRGEVRVNILLTHRFATFAKPPFRLDPNCLPIFEKKTMLQRHLHLSAKAKKVNSYKQAIMSVYFTKSLALEVDGYHCANADALF